MTLRAAFGRIALFLSVRPFLRGRLGFTPSLLDVLASNIDLVAVMFVRFVTDVIVIPLWRISSVAHRKQNIIDALPTGLNYRRGSCVPDMKSRDCSGGRRRQIDVCCHLCFCQTNRGPEVTFQGWHSLCMPHNSF